MAPTVQMHSNTIKYHHKQTITEIAITFQDVEGKVEGKIVPPYQRQAITASTCMSGGGSNSSGRQRAAHVKCMDRGIA